MPVEAAQHVPRAVDVCRCPDLLGDAARALLNPAISPTEYLEQLAARNLHADGLTFLAYSLPPRELIWWGCLCVEHAGGGKLPKAEETALGAAVRWVLAPSEETVDFARSAGAAAGSKTPAGCLAKAAGQAGYPKQAEQPLAPARPQQLGRMAAAAVTAAARQLRKGAVDALPVYLQLGCEVAQGKHRWQHAGVSRDKEATQ